MNPYRPWKSGASAPRQAQQNNRALAPGDTLWESRIGAHNSAETAEPKSDEFAGLRVTGDKARLFYCARNAALKGRSSTSFRTPPLVRSALSWEKP
jgi:hypothetical protein